MHSKFETARAAASGERHLKLYSLQFSVLHALTSRMAQSCLSDSDGEDIGCEQSSAARPTMLWLRDPCLTVTGQKHQDAYCKVCKTQHGVLLLTFILHDALKFELHVPRSGYC